MEGSCQSHFPLAALDSNGYDTLIILHSINEVSYPFNKQNNLSICKVSINEKCHVKYVPVL